MKLNNKNFARILILIWQCIKFVSSTPIPTEEDGRYKPLLRNDKSAYTTEIMRLAKAFELHNFMNEAVSPCEDFYEFACGNWKTINKANTEPTTGFFELLSKGMTLKISKLLSNKTDDPFDTETDKKVKRFHTSCMKLYGSPLQAVNDKLHAIIQEFGTMPALVGDSWNATEFDWLETIARIHHKYGIQIILSVDLMADFRDNRINRIYLGATEFGLESKSMYLDDDNAVYRTLYRRKIAEQLRKYLSVPDEVAERTAAEILRFEMQLATGMREDKLAASLADLTILTTVDEMQQKYAPTIDVGKYLRILWGEEVKDAFYEYVESFQQNLKKLIEDKPKRTIANYIFYMLASDFFPKMGRNMKEQYEVCERAVNKMFAKNLDNMIYRRYNNENTERDINVIWNEIKNAFKRELNSNKLNWIANRTRQYALEKLDAMKMEINSYADTNFTAEFGDLVINNEDFIDNMKSIYEHYMKQLIAELHKPPKPFEAGIELSYTPANVILENKIKIPVSLLQPYYFWDDNYPTALKFGTLGFLIGHELIHGFDDSGREYDKYGNNRDWWDEKSTAAFNDRTLCFKDQYHQYTFGGRLLPESEAQSENIADNGGVRVAYDAYLNWLKEAKRIGTDLSTQTLPTMNYTNKQLFFIGYAQIWCSDINPAVMAMQTATDEHTPNIYRVIGTLSNYAEFAKEFNCPVGSVMNPSKRCEIY